MARRFQLGLDVRDGHLLFAVRIARILGKSSGALSNALNVPLGRGGTNPNNMQQNKSHFDKIICDFYLDSLYEVFKL